MQRIQKLFDDDSAVSPVIGVILMVAITVILAAVIASFVLGLGDSANDVQPNVQFDTEQDGNSSFTISIDTADSTANGGDFVVQAERTDSDDFSGSSTWSSSASWVSSSGSEDMNAGDSFEIDLNSTDDGTAFDSNIDNELEVTIVFQTDDTSSQVETYTVEPKP